MKINAKKTAAIIARDIEFSRAENNAEIIGNSLWLGVFAALYPEIQTSMRRGPCGWEHVAQGDGFTLVFR